MDNNEHNLNEAKIKDKILIFAQSAGSQAVISSIDLRSDFPDMHQDKIRYYLELIAKDGYLKRYGSHRTHFSYDYSADGFLLNGGYKQQYLNSFKNDKEEDVSSIIVTLITQAIDNNIKEDFGSISNSLNRISKEFEDDEADWFNIANSCRAVLIEFVRELETKNKITVEKNEQMGNVKLLLGKLVSGRLKNLVNSIWDFSQKMTHVPGTTKQEAIRLFVWTTLTINEIVSILDVGE